MKPILNGLLAAVLLLGLPLQARANTILPIINASFEAPITGSATYDGTGTDWIFEGTGGVWNLAGLDGCPGDCWTPISPPDGLQIGWLSVGSGSPGIAGANPSAMYQVLSSTLTANSTYTLTGFVGHPLHFTSQPDPGGQPTLYGVELWAGGNLLTSMSATGPEADFAPFTLSYFSGLGPGVGQALKVRLTSNQAQTGFDKIQLSVPDGGMTAVLLGLAIAGLGIVRRRIP